MSTIDVGSPVEQGRHPGIGTRLRRGRGAGSFRHALIDETIEGEESTTAAITELPVSLINDNPDHRGRRIVLLPGGRDQDGWRRPCTREEAGCQGHTGMAAAVACTAAT